MQLHFWQLLNVWQAFDMEPWWLSGVMMTWSLHTACGVIRLVPWPWRSMNIDWFIEWLMDWVISSFICMIIDWNDHWLAWSLTGMVIDPSIAMLPVSCEQLLSLAGLFFHYTHSFLYKNKVYKNIQAQITWNLRIK